MVTFYATHGLTDHSAVGLTGGAVLVFVAGSDKVAETMIVSAGVWRTEDQANLHGRQNRRRVFLSVPVTFPISQRTGALKANVLV